MTNFIISTKEMETVCAFVTASNNVPTVNWYISVTAQAYPLSFRSVC